MRKVTIIGKTMNSGNVTRDVK